MIKIGNEPKEISYILHIGDIHIGAGISRHAEYRAQFDKVGQMLKEWPTDRGTLAVFIAGDIFHFKTRLMPEDIELFYYLLNVFADHPTIIIPGNHDTNLNNRQAIDLISPLLKNYHGGRAGAIYFLRDTGIYNIGGRAFVHISVLDSIGTKGIKELLASTNEEKILLYHGMINGAKFGAHTHCESRITNEILAAVSFAMLGDIHEPQTIQNAAYCGSFIQQNLGEGRAHGYIVWSCKNKSKVFQNVENDCAFVKIDLSTDWKADWADKKIPKKIHNLCVVVKNDYGGDSQEIKEVEKFFNATATKIAIRRGDRRKDTREGISDIRNLEQSGPGIKNGIDSETGKQSIIGAGNISAENTKAHDNDAPSMLEFQKQILSEILSDMLEEQRAEILKIHTNMSSNTSGNIGGLNTSHITMGDFTRKRNKWCVTSIEWSNLFKYGGGNAIDFKNIHGISGIIAENRAGKSSVIDIIAFGLFGAHLRGDNTSIINWLEKTSALKIVFEVNEIPHRVEIQLSRTRAKLVKLYSRDDDITAETVPATYNKIAGMIGTFAEFVATSLYTQETPDIIKMKKTERKKQLGVLFGIEDIAAAVDRAKVEYKILKEELTKYAKPLMLNHEFNMKILDENLKMLADNYNRMHIEKDAAVEYVAAVDAWIKKYNWSENVAGEVAALKSAMETTAAAFSRACMAAGVDPSSITAGRKIPMRSYNDITGDIAGLESWFKRAGITEPTRATIENYILMREEQLAEARKAVAVLDGQLLKINDKHKAVAKKYEGLPDKLDKAIVDITTSIKNMEIARAALNYRPDPSAPQFDTLRKEIDDLTAARREAEDIMRTIEATERAIVEYNADILRQKFKFEKQCAACVNNMRVISDRVNTLRGKISDSEAVLAKYNKSSIADKIRELGATIEDRTRALGVIMEYTQFTNKLREYESQIENLNLVRLYIKQIETRAAADTIAAEIATAEKNLSALVGLYDARAQYAMQELQNLASDAAAAASKYTARVEALAESKQALPIMPDYFRELCGGKINIEKFRAHIAAISQRIEDNIVMRTRTRVDLEAYIKDLVIYKQYEEFGRPIEQKITNMKKYIDTAGGALQFRLIKQYMKNIEADLNNVLAAVCDFRIHIETTDSAVEFIIDESGHRSPVDLGSGYQKFIICLAFRLALINNLHCSADFMFVDEGFGCIDGNNLKHIGGLFLTMKDIFKYIFIISHVDELNNIIEFPLYIKQYRGYSFINNGPSQDILYQEQILRAEAQKSIMEGPSPGPISQKPSIYSPHSVLAPLTPNPDESKTIASGKDYVLCACGSRIMAKNYQKHIVTATHLKKIK